MWMIFVLRHKKNPAVDTSAVQPFVQTLSLTSQHHLMIAENQAGGKQVCPLCECVCAYVCVCVFVLKCKWERACTVECFSCVE